MFKPLALAKRGKAEESRRPAKLKDTRIPLQSERRQNEKRYDASDVRSKTR